MCFRNVKTNSWLSIFLFFDQCNILNRVIMCINGVCPFMCVLLNQSVRNISASCFTRSNDFHHLQYNDIPREDRQPVCHDEYIPALS